MEVGVFFIFLISQDEQHRKGVVGDDALSGVCVAAFSITTILFSIKYVQEMVLHRDTIAALIIQVSALFVSFSHRLTVWLICTSRVCYGSCQ
jgi:hypothetical protein